MSLALPLRRLAALAVTGAVAASMLAVAPATAAGGYNLLNAAQLRRVVVNAGDKPTGLGPVTRGLYSAIPSRPTLCNTADGRLQTLAMPQSQGEVGWMSDLIGSSAGGYVLVSQYGTWTQAEAAGARLMTVQCPEQAQMRLDEGAPRIPVWQETQDLPDLYGQPGRLIAMTWTEPGARLTQTIVSRQIGNVVIQVAATSRPQVSQSWESWALQTLKRVCARYQRIAYGDSPTPPGA